MVLDDSVHRSVGVDISKNTLDVHFLPEARSLQVPNTAEGRAKLLAQLPPPGTCRIVLEATGISGQRRVAELVPA